MLESIALALAKTLTTYLFKTYVLLSSDIKIDGAPYWYMQNNSAAVCVYDHETGGMESVDVAKSAAADKMQTELARILRIVAYDNFRNLKDPKEQKFIDTFVTDQNAPVFVSKNMQFANIEYSKKHRETFLKACIDKQTIVDYQNERIAGIKYGLTHMRADSAFDELESGDDSLEK